MSSLAGIALNRAWPSTGSCSCVIALISNPVSLHPIQSTYVLAPCVASYTKLPTAGFSAKIWLRVFVASKGEEGGSPRKLVNGRTRPRAVASPRWSATQRKTPHDLRRYAAWKTVPSCRPNVLWLADFLFGTRHSLRSLSDIGGPGGGLCIDSFRSLELN
jgi:hypothetical protein